MMQEQIGQERSTGFLIERQGPHDREIQQRTDELLVWVDALKGPVNQLREDRLSRKGLAAALAALEIAEGKYSEARGRLVETCERAEP